MSKRSADGTNVVKNRAPAPIQISAEQIVREAADRQEIFPIAPVIKIHDGEEYQSYLRDRRKLFEDNIRYRREHIGNWIKYAKFEEENKEYERSRSIFERALEVDHRSSELWLRYCEFEIRNEFINHARNVLDRAIQLLPRVDFLWYKYVYIEEMMQDIPKCRAVFERWMEWIPDDNAWVAYAKFETRCQQYTNAENIMRRYVNAYPVVQAYIKFAKWAEYEIKNILLARTIYESALRELEPEESKQAKLFKQFAAFEERQGEYNRARVIYQHAIHLFKLGQNQEQEEEQEEISEQEKYKRDELYKAYLSFESKYGNRERIENVILTQQRSTYQQHLQDNPYDYDTWLELIKLEEENQQLLIHQQKQSSSLSSIDQKEIQMARNLVRDTYERAVSNVPPVTTQSSTISTAASTTSSTTATNYNSNGKDNWRRYIYLWIYYAVYEELINHDLDRAIQVYETCIKLIPHKQFSFTKIWILAAKVHIRRKDITAARKLLGKGLGLCKKKEKIYIEYIQIELSLGEIDRCRTLYTNYLKDMPNNCMAWIKFADMEKSLGETDRCRAIYELAVSQSRPLDMPELIWKSYIDFEISESESDNVRKLYQRLIDKTSPGHVKVWISCAQFEATDLGRGIESARSTFQKAYDLLKKQQKEHIQDDEHSTADTEIITQSTLRTKEDMVLLLDAWRVFEKTTGDLQSIASVEAKMPRRIKRKRMRYADNEYNDDGTRLGLGWEEYFDYQFPEDENDGNDYNAANAPANNFKILEMAAKWKQQQQHNDDDSEIDSDDDE